MQPITMAEVLATLFALAAKESDPGKQAGLHIAITIVCGAESGGIHEIAMDTGQCRRCGLQVVRKSAGL